MKNKKTLREIGKEILKEMYRNTEPKTLDNHIEHFKNSEEMRPYLNFYLSDKEQDDIIKRHRDKYNLSKHEFRSLLTYVHLDLPSPSFFKQGDN